LSGDKRPIISSEYDKFLGEKLAGLQSTITGLNQADKFILLNMFSRQMHSAWEQDQTKLVDVIVMAQNCVNEASAFTEPVKKVTIDLKSHENRDALNMIFNYEKAGRKLYQPYFGYF